MHASNKRGSDRGVHTSCSHFDNGLQHPTTVNVPEVHMHLTQGADVCKTLDECIFQLKICLYPTCTHSPDMRILHAPPSIVGARNILHVPVGGMHVCIFS